ncbi:hypothetical protein GCM10009853_072620 [Glycomyces scopariae]
MSRSVHTATARMRAAFTGETPIAAEYGRGRQGNLGLDRCIPAQLEMRSRLAWHLFNRGWLSTLPYESTISRIASYSPVVSARYKELVLVAKGAPVNVLGYFFNAPEAVFPGLRLTHSVRWEEGPDGPDRPQYERYETVHVPTGAKFIVTSHPDTTREVGKPGYGSEMWVRVDMKMADSEAFNHKLMPPMSIGIQRILAALVARFNSRDPGGRWATGSWEGPPMGRKSEGVGADYSRGLSGGGEVWSLRWTLYPTVRDIVDMLADPVFGVPEIEIQQRTSSADLKLGDALLRLQRV